MITRTIVQRSDIIKALAYKLYNNSEMDLLSLKKSEALKIVRKAIWWSGKTGWQGDRNSVTDIIGEFEAFEAYQDCENIAIEYVDKHFPNITNEI